MYKVIHEPDYDERVELGKTETPQEAIEMIYFYCSKHHYVPNIFHWSKMDDPSCEVIDVSTGHDVFLIINEDGGTVKLEPVIDTTFCSATDCKTNDCPLHPSHSNETSKFSDLTCWCNYYLNQFIMGKDPHNIYEFTELAEEYGIEPYEHGEIVVAAAVLTIVTFLITFGLVILSICTKNPNWMWISPIAFIVSNILITILGISIKNREEN